MHLNDITGLILRKLRWGFIRLDGVPGIFLPTARITIFLHDADEWRLVRRTDRLGHYTVVRTVGEIRDILEADHE